MASESVIRSYMVKLGWKIDQQQFREFQHRLKQTAEGAAEVAKSFMQVGKATVAGLAVAGLAIKKTADVMADMYYASKRVGSSVAELDALQFGFKQVGLSAEQARGSVEALATARRTNPGLNGLLGSLGIDPKNANNAQVFIQLLAKMRDMPQYLRAQYGAMFGLDESVINQAELFGPELAKGIAQRSAQIKRDRVDLDKQAKDSAEALRKWNETTAKYRDLFVPVFEKMLPFAEKFVTLMGRAVDWLIRADRSTHGWVSSLLAVGTALTPILAALKLMGGFKVAKTLFGGLRKLLGLGAAEEAAGGAAAAAEAAGGVGLMEVIGPLIPVIVTAVLAVGAIAALVYAVTHPEQVKKAWDATKRGLDKFDSALHGWVDPKAAAVKSAIVGKHNDLNAQAKELGGWQKALEAQTGFIGDAARFTAKFEGFRAKAYRDIAGKLTIGVGHLIRPGEDFSNATPAQLMKVFQDDFAKHVRHVMSVVRVALNTNQLKALSDLAFNIGDAAFDASTLLKKLNGGDYAGAAAEFARWNKIHQGGHLVPSAGLTSRRQADADMFRQPVDQSKQITLHSKTEINVHTSDPDAAGRAVESRQRGIYADLTRNLATVIE